MSELNPEAVREALEWFFPTKPAFPGPYPTAEMAQEATMTVAAAARDWLRDQENSETIWWCEEHECSRDPDFKDECWVFTTEGESGPCRMVERRLNF